MRPSLPAALIVGGGQTSLVSNPPTRSLVRKCLPTAGSGKHSLTITQVKQPKPFFFLFFGVGK